MKLTLRAHVARALQLVDQGEWLVAKVRGILLAAASVKILVPSLSTEILLALAPVALVVQALLGWWWVRRALYREMQEIGLADAWSPKDMWAIWMQVRLLRAHGIDPKDYDPHDLPEDYRKAVLASVKEPRTP